MDPLERLDESDELLSENEESFAEANWRKAVDHSAPARELLTHANAESAHSRGSDPHAVRTTILDPLYALERTARLDGDINTVVRLVEEICAVHFALGDYISLQKSVKQLVQSRGQTPQAQIAILKKTMAIISQHGVALPFGAASAEQPPATSSSRAPADLFTPVVVYPEIGNSAAWNIDETSACAILVVVRSLSQGRMHLELEFAQASMILAKVSERNGVPTRALRILQKVGIERLSAISRVEKTKCLVYQLALARDQRNFVAFEKIVRKVSRSTLENAANAWLCRNYLLHLIAYFSSVGRHFATFVCYWELFSCRESASQIVPAVLRRAIFHLLLAPPESQDVRRDAIECTIYGKKYEGQLDRSDWISFFQKAFEISDTKSRFSSAERDVLFQSDVIPRASMEELLQFFIRSKWTPVDEFLAAWEASKLSAEITQPAERDTILHRFAERNILTISGYYSNITMARLAQLVAQSEDDVEALLRQMVHQKLVNTKIDRVDRVVEFVSKSPRVDVDILNDSVKEILNLVEQTCHLIEKDRVSKGSCLVAVE
ncbi:hypothetical protein XU18_3460 [Perkinsela sp. CCAP 1560/4]|nr:hypothetical protein XU18_3460 [Perkinsela sp. CCAP 1560/4]|eukprot:KNH05489.1 hypothetical protein XU18_3460 [Perkinsela sp. CCAP 1560/4]